MKSENHTDFWFFNTVSLVTIKNPYVSAFYFSLLENLRALSKQYLDCKSEGEKQKFQMESEFPLWLDVSEGSETSGSKIIIQMGWVNLTRPKVIFLRKPVDQWYISGNHLCWAESEDMRAGKVVKDEGQSMEDHKRWGQKWVTQRVALLSLANTFWLLGQPSASSTQQCCCLVGLSPGWGKISKSLILLKILFN